MNRVILKGRLARDVELRTTASGKSVASITLAVNRRFQQEGQPTADFIPCVAWGKTAEVMSQYLYKGREIALEGRMQIRSYEDKNGNKRYVTEVMVDSFEFCGSSNGGGSQQGGESQAAGFGTEVHGMDIPF